MGFFKKLFGIGATAATTVAAVKVTEKYKENNPNGVQDVNGDGKVDYKDVAIEVKKAIGDVYEEVADKVKEKAPDFVEDVKEKTAQAKEAVADICGEIKDAVPKAVEDAIDTVESTMDEIRK